MLQVPCDLVILACIGHGTKTFHRACNWFTCVCALKFKQRIEASFANMQNQTPSFKLRS